MSILDRNNLMQEKVCTLSADYTILGDRGIWESYLKGIKLSDDGISEIHYHLSELIEYNKFVEKYFNNENTEEGYFILISETKIDIYSASKLGLIYATDHLVSKFKDGYITCGMINNYPNVAFRGLKCYLPSKNNIEKFYNLIDFCLAYGLNTLVLEVGGAMIYKSHPEINSGWVEYCNKFKDYPGKSVEYQFSMDIPKNSIHWENAGGMCLTQEEVKEIVIYAKNRGLDVIPEIPSLSHSDYLLYNHKDLAERVDDPTPDAYCPSNPNSKKLVCDLMDEIIAVFEPKTIHIGHDELYTVALCDKCKDKDPAKLFADDVNFYYEYLRKRNIKTMMWGDKLLNAIGKAGHKWGGAKQYHQRKDGSIKCVVPEMKDCYNYINENVIIMNWYWSVDRKFDEYLLRKFKTVYGNFRGVEMPDYENRLKSNCGGFCVSNWSESSELLLQRNSIYFHLAYSSAMFWSDHFNKLSYKDKILMVSNELFDFNNREVLQNNYIEVTHTTNNFHDHEEFVDGYFIDEKYEALGKYVFEFEDGSIIEYKVDYGYNIGFSGNNFEHEENFIYDIISFDKQLFETTKTCKYIYKNNKMFYKILIPCVGKTMLKSYKFIPNNAETVEILEVNLIKVEKN